LGQPVRQASALAYEESVCHPEQERKRKKQRVPSRRGQTEKAREMKLIEMLDCLTRRCVSIIVQVVMVDTSESILSDKKVK